MTNTVWHCVRQKRRPRIKAASFIVSAISGMRAALTERSQEVLWHTFRRNRKKRVVYPPEVAVFIILLTRAALHSQILASGGIINSNSKRLSADTSLLCHNEYRFCAACKLNFKFQAI